MQQQPHMLDGIVCGQDASLDGTHRWQRALGWAAPATLRPALLPRHCFAASRRAPCLWQSHPCHLPCAGRRRIPRFVLSSPQNAPTSRAGAHSFFARRPRTHLDPKTQTERRRIASIYSRCGPRKVREQFNNSRCAPRDAGCRARCPRPRKNCFPERVRGICIRAARATAYGCDP